MIMIYMFTHKKEKKNRKEKIFNLPKYYSKSYYLVEIGQA